MRQLPPVEDKEAVGGGYKGGSWENGGDPLYPRENYPPLSSSL